MDSINRHVSNIIKANNDNSLVIFVGAGISKLSETASLKLPVWSDLIEELKRELGDNGESDYLKIAQLYYLEFGEYSYYKLIKSYFPEYIKPSEAHKLIFEINPHVVVTTNWDNILERAVEENAYFYDLVCSDRDLVKSRLQNKLIKMHGDFKSHNIVFKEDDYLNYKYNFPLMENYIKSLLSTHTVLFLGYSYNDINLKQISKWIQQHSTVRPPIYLAAHKANPTQVKYLENHGITTLVISQDEGDDYLSRSVQFLKRIKLNDLERVVETDEEAVLYVLERLKELDGLEGILLEHVRKALTNCDFIYDNDRRSILRFHSDVLTRDIDLNKRDIYRRFIDVVARLDGGEKPTSNIVSIFTVLVRAQIKGIFFKSLPGGGGEYFDIESHVEVIDDTSVTQYINFESDCNESRGDIVSSKFDEAYRLYQNGKDEESYVLTEDLILSFLKQRNYILAFVGMFNRNALLYGLKYGFTRTDERYASIEEYDLENRFYNLPKDSQVVTEPLYQFLNFSYMYKEAYRATTKLRKVQDSNRTIERGGSVFGNNVNEMAAVHSNLVYFVLKNKIMIEDYVEYKSTNEHYIQIAIARQAHNKTLFLTRIEVFSCVKYVGNKELKKLLEHLYLAGKKAKSRLTLSPEDSEWLVDVVLKNIALKFLADSKKGFGAYEDRLLNVIFYLH